MTKKKKKMKKNEKEREKWLIIDIGNRHFTTFHADCKDADIILSPTGSRNESTIISFLSTHREIGQTADHLTCPDEKNTIRDIMYYIGSKDVLYNAQISETKKQYQIQSRDILSYFMDYIIENKKYENIIFIMPHYWKLDENKKNCFDDACKILELGRKKYCEMETIPYKPLNIQLFDSMDAIAYDYFFRIMSSEKTKRVVILADCGSYTTTVSVFKMTNKDIKQYFSRTIDLGGEDITNALGNHFLDIFRKDETTKDEVPKIEKDLRLQTIFKNCVRKTKEQINEHTKILFKEEGLNLDSEFKYQVSESEIMKWEEIKDIYNKFVSFFKTIKKLITDNAELKKYSPVIELRGGNGRSAVVKKAAAHVFQNGTITDMLINECIPEGAAFFQSTQIPGYDETIIHRSSSFTGSWKQNIVFSKDNNFSIKSIELDKSKDSNNDKIDRRRIKTEFPIQKERKFHYKRVETNFEYKTLNDKQANHASGLFSLFKDRDIIYLQRSEYINGIQTFVYSLQRVLKRNLSNTPLIKYIEFSGIENISHEASEFIQNVENSELNKTEKQIGPKDIINKYNEFKDQIIDVIIKGEEKMMKEKFRERPTSEQIKGFINETNIVKNKIRNLFIPTPIMQNQFFNHFLVDYNNADKREKEEKYSKAPKK